MSGLAFGAPGRLVLLLGVVALVVAYLVVQRRRGRYAVRFSSLPLLDRVAPKRPLWRRHVPAGLFLLMLVASVTAFARPSADVRVPREEATVVVALDVSASMSAEDVSPDRITVARAAAADFVEDLPDQFRVGLVLFSGEARAAVSPTEDRDAVLDALGAARLSGGTAIGDAVLASLRSVETSTEAESADVPPTRIVLLSDGTSTSGAPVEQAADAAAAAGVQVSTIAYGTDDGVIEVDGQRVPVPVDEETLRSLAETTGGSAYDAESDDELRDVYDNLESSIGTKTERQEVTAWFVGAALVAALLAAVASLAWFARLP